MQKRRKNYASRGKNTDRYLLKKNRARRFKIEQNVPQVL